MPGARAPLVLVVEDRGSIRLLLEVALAREGWRVRSVPMAELALEALATEVPDVVLVDLLLPGQRGDEFIATLRELPGGRDIPVIVLSGIEGGLLASRAAGAQDFLAKPFDVEELLARVRAHLQAPA